METWRRMRAWEDVRGGGQVEPGQARVGFRTSTSDLFSLKITSLVLSRRIVTFGTAPNEYDALGARLQPSPPGLGRCRYCTVRPAPMCWRAPDRGPMAAAARVRAVGRRSRHRGGSGAAAAARGWAGGGRPATAGTGRVGMPRRHCRREVKDRGRATPRLTEVEPSAGHGEAATVAMATVWLGARGHRRGNVGGGQRPQCVGGLDHHRRTCRGPSSVLLHTGGRRGDNVSSACGRGARKPPSAVPVRPAAIVDEAAVGATTVDHTPVWRSGCHRGTSTQVLADALPTPRAAGVCPSCPSRGNGGLSTA